MRPMHQIIFAGKLLLVVLSLSGVCLFHDGNWLVDTKEKLSYLIDFDKNEAENVELEIEVDKFVKDLNNLFVRQPALKGGRISLYADFTSSLHLDVTTPPPQPLPDL